MFINERMSMIAYKRNESLCMNIELLWKYRNALAVILECYKSDKR
jgi:hypothetical protein